MNKNALTGLTNCKKTTRHRAHLSLCAKSRKTNDAKSRKWPKTSIWAIFLTILRSNISKLQIFLKNRFHSNWRSYLVLTSGQKPKNHQSRFLSLFYLYSPLTSCKKSEKSLKPFLRKLCYQPTNYYQQHRFYWSWLTPVQK